MVMSNAKPMLNEYLFYKSLYPSLTTIRNSKRSYFLIFHEILLFISEDFYLIG